DPSHGNHGMTDKLKHVPQELAYPGRTCFSLSVWLLAALVLTCAAFAQIHVTTAGSSLVDQGLASTAPVGSEAAAFQQVPSPGVRFQMNEAQATAAPWIDSNAWRFERGLKKANYAKLLAGAAPLAAAEAFAFDVEAILNPDPADLPELGRMLQF